MCVVRILIDQAPCKGRIGIHRWDSKQFSCKQHQLYWAGALSLGKSVQSMCCTTQRAPASALRLSLFGELLLRSKIWKMSLLMLAHCCPYSFVIPHCASSIESSLVHFKSFIAHSCKWWVCCCNWLPSAICVETVMFLPHLENWIENFSHCPNKSLYHYPIDQLSHYPKLSKSSESLNPEFSIIH